MYRHDMMIHDICISNIILSLLCEISYVDVCFFGWCFFLIGCFCVLYIYTHIYILIFYISSNLGL